MNGLKTKKTVLSISGIVERGTYAQARVRHGRPSARRFQTAHRSARLSEKNREASWPPSFHFLSPE